MQLLFIGWTEILVIALVVLLLFGGKKIPELMKGMGQGVKSFKDGMNGIDDKSQAAAKRDDPTALPHKAADDTARHDSDNGDSPRN